MIAETAAFGTGTLMGAGMKLAGKLLDSYSNVTISENQVRIAKIQSEQKALSAAREFALAFSGGVWARRFMVLTVFSYLFVFPFWAALKEIKINYLYVGEGAGIMGWIFGIGEGIKTATMEGFTIMPFQPIIASYMAGFYFGASTVK